MKISVVIPAYNEEKYIGKCLSSLLNQNFQGDFEIIVCLNACTDKTKEKVLEIKKNLQSKFERKTFLKPNVIKIRIVEEERKGVGFARQRGTNAALGEIIASADADTEYPPNWLERIVLNFEKNPKVSGLYGPVFIKDGGLGLQILARYIYTSFLCISKIFGNDNVAGMNFAFRKKFFDKVGGYDINLKSAEDIDLAKKLKNFGKIKFDRKLFVFTSARRFKGRFLKSFWHHIKNYLRVFIFKKSPEDFEDIR